MLTYPVKSLIKDPSLVITVKESLELEPRKYNGELVEFLTPVRVEGELRHVGGWIIEFKGTLDFDVRMACGRCTRPTDLPLHSDMVQRYIADRQENESGDEDVEVYFDEVIDLSDLIYSEISLAIPMKVLCREDCKGLCPHCGKDLNEGPCDCSQEDTDPRWDALKSLLQ